MTKLHRKKKSTSIFQNPIFRNPVVVGGIITATITGIVGIVIAFINVLPQLNRPEPEPTKPPVMTATAFIPATNTPTEGLPTLELTATQTATFPTLPSDSPTPSLPTLNCLSNWLRVDTMGLPTPTPTATSTPANLGGCSPISEFGISTISDQLIFSKQGLKNVQGLLGISHRIDSGYSIELTVTANILFNAEFWIALSEGVNPSPIDNPLDVVSMAVVPQSQGGQSLTGTIALYRGANKIDDKKWIEILGNSPAGPPFVYHLNIRVAAGHVAITVNGREVANQNGIFPNYLFLGYNKKATAGSVVVNVSVSDLKLTPVK